VKVEKIWMSIIEIIACLERGRRAKLQFSNIFILLGYSKKMKNEMRGYHETIGGNFCSYFLPSTPLFRGEFWGEKEDILRDMFYN